MRLGSAGDSVTTKRKWYRRPKWGLICAAMLSVVVSGCVQASRTGTRLPEPNQGTGAVATSDPLVLNGVAYAQGHAATQPNNSRPPPNADVVAVPAAVAPEPVASSAPLPQSGPPPTTPPVTATQPNASPAAPATQTNAQPVPVTTADGYPNINLTPQQPQSKLLTPEERAKLIDELNALAGRSGAGQ